MRIRQRGHGPLKFTWKWEINLSHLSTLARPSGTGPNQEAVFMHLNHKFHLRLRHASSLGLIGHLCEGTRPESLTETFTDISK